MPVHLLIIWVLRSCRSGSCARRAWGSGIRMIVCVVCVLVLAVVVPSCVLVVVVPSWADILPLLIASPGHLLPLSGSPSSRLCSTCPWPSDCPCNCPCSCSCRRLWNYCRRRSSCRLCTFPLPFQDCSYFHLGCSSTRKSSVLPFDK